MDSERLNDLLEQLQSRRIDRREFMRRAAALGLSAPLIGLLMRSQGALAQAGNPSGAAGGAQATKSISREEFEKQLKEKFNFEEPQNKGGQVILGYTTDISTVNGILSADYPSAYINGFIFEALVGGSPIDGTPVPALADSWDIAEDGVTYTFHLNQQAKWHDGQPFTADDVKFSFDAELNPKTGSQYTSAVAQDLDSYRVVDPHTFEFKSKGKIATFLWDVPGTVLIMPKHIWENVPPQDWANNPGSTGQDPSKVVGTGPFKFKEWKQGDHVTVVRNDDYYDVKPVIDSFTIQVYPKEETALSALKTGGIDLYETVPPALVKDMQSAPGVKVDIYDNFNFNWYAYNLDPTKSKVFQDVEVRRALFMALDRKLIADRIYLGEAEVAEGTQPKLSIAYAPDKITHKYDYDVEGAKKLLDQAGWKVGSDGVREKNGVKLAFTAQYSQGVSTYDQMLPYMQQAWKAVGAKVNLKAVPFPTLLDTMNKTHDFDMVLLGFSWDVTGNQGAMFDCDSYNGGFNVMKYCNPKYDELDDQQRHELDPAKRIPLLIELSNIANDDLPVGIFIFRKTPSAYATRVHNYFPNGYSLLWSLTYAWVEK